ncbi:MAG: radical SAM/SPASM domain-containing protein [Armatimonadota bacterium]
MRPLSAPVKVSLDVTEACNLACAHCRSLPRCPPASPLTHSELLAVIDDLAAMSVFRLGLSGGEPLLRPELPELVHHAVARGVGRVLISTNATLITPAMLRELTPSRGRITLKASLDGPPQVHDGLRGVEGACAGTLRGLRLAVGEGFAVQLTTTLMRPNLAHLAQIIDLGAELDCAAHFIVEVLPVGRAGMELLLSAKDRREAAAVIADRSRACAHRVVGRLAFAGDAGFGYSCEAGVAECGILADGTIVGCRLLPEVSEGNVRDRPVSEVWRSADGFRFFRRSIDGALPNACRACASHATCRGGCRAWAYHVSGDLRGPDLRCPVLAGDAER